MNFLFWGLTIGTLGKALLAVGVLIAHNGIVRERKIDSDVIRRFRIEHSLTLLGLVLIVLGYALEVYFYGFTINILNCQGTECAAAISAALAQ